MTIARHRAALFRPALSRPMRIAIEDGLLSNRTYVFDYGCGRGDDVRHLKSQGIHCKGWDPEFFPKVQRSAADLVNLGYVINVIEDPTERAEVLRKAWALTRKLLVVSARHTLEATNENQALYGDGRLTSRGTFQKYFEQKELRNWIEGILNTACVPAALGIYYVFRDPELRESFVASRYRRSAKTPRPRQSDVLFEKHKTLLDPLMKFVSARGRLPDHSELATSDQIDQELGSIRRAFQIIRRVTGSKEWDTIREERAQDLLLYLALARFGGRPQFTKLSRDLQLDVRAFYSTYNRACTKADELLFSAGDLKSVDAACRTAEVGKLTPSSLYIHASASPHLPPILRIYEGCARGYIGTLEGVNVVKLHRATPEISYLSYPKFEQDPHPALAGSLIVHLQTFKIRYRDYRSSENPPILHRKEEFLTKDHPLHSKFARLTRQEENWGLYEHPEAIGTREGWQKILDEKGLKFAGHRVLRSRVS